MAPPLNPSAICLFNPFSFNRSTVPQGSWVDEESLKGSPLTSKNFEKLAEDPALKLHLVDLALRFHMRFITSLQCLSMLTLVFPFLSFFQNKLSIYRQITRYYCTRKYFKLVIDVLFRLHFQVRDFDRDLNISSVNSWENRLNFLSRQ